MKVLHLNTERTWRGGEQQCLYLLKGLKKHNFLCHLVCQPGSPIEQRAKASDIKVFPLTMRSEVDLVAACQLRSLIQRGSYDIIHSHTSHAHTLAFLASCGLQTKRLVTRRVAFSIYRHSFLRLNGIKYRYMADYYVAISRRIKQVLMSDGISGQRIFVAHSGTDVERFKGVCTSALIREFNIKPGDPIVLNVAHLSREKGQKHLIKAIPRVLQEIPKARFFVVGEGKLRSELVHLATSLRLNSKIFFTGFRRDVGAFYRVADLFVMSSLQEGLGTAVLDALALGIPVVATRTGGIPEYVSEGKTGRLIPPGDHEALAKGIVHMLKNPGEAFRMAFHGRTIVRANFSVEAMVDKNLDIYRRILRSSDGPQGEA